MWGSFPQPGKCSGLGRWAGPRGKVLPHEESTEFTEISKPRPWEPGGQRLWEKMCRCTHARARTRTHQASPSGQPHLTGRMCFSSPCSGGPCLPTEPFPGLAETPTLISATVISFAKRCRGQPGREGVGVLGWESFLGFPTQSAGGGAVLAEGSGLFPHYSFQDAVSLPDFVVQREGAEAGSA